MGKVKQRLIIDMEIDGVDPRDYPDFTDAYATYAVWNDTKEELTGPELDQLNEDYQELVQEAALESLI